MRGCLPFLHKKEMSKERHVITQPEARNVPIWRFGNLFSPEAQSRNPTEDAGVTFKFSSLPCFLKQALGMTDGDRRALISVRKKELHRLY